jgi:hypothetical protein
MPTMALFHTVAAFPAWSMTALHFRRRRLGQVHGQRPELLPHPFGLETATNGSPLL